MQGGTEADAARTLCRRAEERQRVGRDAELRREVMVDGRIHIEAHLIRVLDLTLDLPVELRMRLLRWALHLRINTKPHLATSRQKIERLLDTRAIRALSTVLLHRQKEPHRRSLASGRRLLPSLYAGLLLEHANLPQHGSLIPVDALGGHFAVAEIDDNHKLDLDRLAGGRYAGQEPVHLLGVAETHHCFFDDAVVGDNSVNEGMFPPWWNRGNKLITVEWPQRGFPFAAPARGHGDHRG